MNIVKNRLSQFRAAEEDSEYQEYLSDGKAGSSKLWTPGQTLHKTKGGNVIIRPLSASLTSLWQQQEKSAVKEAMRTLKENGRVLTPIGGGAGASAYSFTTTSRTNMLSGNQAIGTDTFKMALFASTSNIGSGSNTFAALTNEASTGGYSAGGTSVTLSLSGTTTVTVAITDASWVVSSTALVFRFGVVYEVAANITAYFTGDSTPADVTTQVGNTLTVSGTNNLFTLA